MYEPNVRASQAISAAFFLEILPKHLRNEYLIRRDKFLRDFIGSAQNAAHIINY